MISNVPEGFDDVDKLSYEQTSGSWLRLLNYILVGCPCREDQTVGKNNASEI